MKKRFLALALISGLLVQAQSDLAILPLPKTMEQKKGSFKIPKQLSVAVNNNSLAQLAAYTVQLLEEFAQVKDVSLADQFSPAKSNTIYLMIDSSAVYHAEGYTLDVRPSFITIKGKTPQGVFYGLQTLSQLIPLDKSQQILAVHIEDEPRFAWRGMMFDNCRHMFSVEFIKQFIDQLAYHKLNKFHWHLTDDQGWRIEIKQYPLLQTIAAFRNGTQYGPNRKKDVDTLRYGGYYTQEQIKEVVAYAASRYIEVIPEIEMPGHSVAAITAYPYLACNDVSMETGQPHEVRKVWGVSKDILCAGNDSVFTFLQDVLSEVMQLFPSQYIHVGGDEAPHDAWKKCPKCQQRMKENGLKNEAELQSWFVRRMGKFISGNGKKLIGWEEIMQGGLAENATVQSWLGTASGLKAAKMGNDAIMSPYSHLYFDGYQAEPKIEPLAIGYWVPLDTVYAFEPLHAALTHMEARHILGAQANLWTEFITTEPYFQYMVFPRMDALAEINWTPKEKRNFTDFEQRLQTQLRRYNKRKINYRIPVPVITVAYNSDSSATVILQNRSGSGVVRYEVNGEKVSNQSPDYKEPIVLRKGDELRFASFIETGRQSSTDYFPKKSKKK
jgi:hexosaminidase